MLDLDRRNSSRTQLSLSQWLYQILKESGLSVRIRLRVRIRGNNLHILCEGSQCPTALQVVSPLVEVFKSSQGSDILQSLTGEILLHRVIIYGKAVGQKRPEWIKPIILSEIRSKAISFPETQNEQKLPGNHDGEEKTTITNYESLARSGDKNAIAVYLSESLSQWGVSVKSLVQKLPDATASQRLWLVCNCPWSLDPNLFAEPIVRRLRDLDLAGFREAVIRSQVHGETTPDWVLLVDLTRKEEMLADWAKWGDLDALTRLLNLSLAPFETEVRANLKDSTLHLFCRLISPKSDLVPDKHLVLTHLTPILEDLVPQGITSYTVYGVKNQDLHSNNSDDTLVWIDWLKFNNHRGDTSTFALAKLEDREALIFLLQKLLNPELDYRLVTGGVQIKLCRKQDLLHVMTEAVICPEKTKVIKKVEKLFRQLTIPGLAGLRIYGRRSGQSSPLWSYGVDFVTRKRQPPVAAKKVSSAAPEVNNNQVQADVSVATFTPEVVTTQPKHRHSLWYEEANQTLSYWLCRSGLLIRSLSQTNLDPNIESNVKARPSLKLTLAWGILGLLLTASADWLVGNTIKSITAFSELNTAAENSLPELYIPESASLNNKEETGFDASDFTRTGARKVEFWQDANSLVEARNSGQTAAILAAARLDIPSFNNRLVDEKLALYQQRVAQEGSPDVLIVGSSRALRGVDPVALEQALAAEGYSNIEVFNFGINGATAQVVDLLLRRVLTPKQLPKLIIWADGARAFNSSREDRTYEAIATSAAYQKLHGEDLHSLKQSNQLGQQNILTNILQDGEAIVNHSLGKISSVYPQRELFHTWLRKDLLNSLKLPFLNPYTNLNLEITNSESELVAIDYDGFLPLSVRFDPERYYQNHPRVTGAHDRDYDSFGLDGQQYTALNELLDFLQTHSIQLVFVNTPLTNEYLDPVRTKYEAEFRSQMLTEASDRGLIFLDYAQRWSTQYELFSDPSHLNRFGAYQVSQQLAKDLKIPWDK
ncbi:MAG: DUF1574 family protein [Oscillatoria sp. PMC 1068.18]|nr:DUF1574 family protein [Oscillatoria sp. PMC 1068.18]